MQQDHSWEANSCWPSEKCPATFGNIKVYYRIQRRMHRLDISWVSSIPSMIIHSLTLKSNLILSTHLHLHFSKSHLPCSFPRKTCTHECFQSLPYPTHLNNWSRVGIMNCFAMEISSSSCYFLSSRHKYSTWNLVPKPPQSMYLSSGDRLSLTSVKRNRVKYKTDTCGWFSIASSFGKEHMLRAGPAFAIM